MSRIRKQQIVLYLRIYVSIITSQMILTIGQHIKILTISQHIKILTISQHIKMKRHTTSAKNERTYLKQGHHQTIALPETFDFIIIGHRSPSTVATDVLFGSASISHSDLSRNSISMHYICNKSV